MNAIRKVILLGYIHNFITIALITFAMASVIKILVLPIYSFVAVSAMLVSASNFEEINQAVMAINNGDISRQELENLSIANKAISEIAHNASEWFFIGIALVYVFGILINYVLQSLSISKNGKIIKKLSERNTKVLLSKSKETDSFRIFKNRYIFLSVSDYINAGNDGLKFIIGHELFHTMCFDSILRRFVISVSFVIPIAIVFNIVAIRLVPYGFGWMNDLIVANRGISMFADHHQLISYFVIIISVPILVFLVFNSSEFMSSFFHYKEYLADRYAMLKTNHIYGFSNRIGNDSIYHPSSNARILAMSTGHSMLNVDYYFYVMSALTMQHNYNYLVIFLGFLLFAVFFLWQKDTYLSLRGFLISLVLCLLPRFSMDNIFSEEFESLSRSNSSAFDGAGYIMVILLIMSFVVSFKNKRRLS